MHQLKIFVLALLILTSGPVSSQQKSKKQARPKNIILMIGDGMSTVQIYAGIAGNKAPLNLEKLKKIGFSKTNSTKFVTDSGAGATAWSTGFKTNNGAIGVDSAGNAQPTVLEIAAAHGLSTGVISTNSITDATPASFIAHQPSRSMKYEIAADYVNSPVDLFIGAGGSNFSERPDGRNLVSELKEKGFQVLFDLEEITKVQSGKLAGFLKEAIMPERGNQLERTALTAINILNKNKKGFFLMVEGSHIDGGGHRNDVDMVVKEMIDFDRAIGKVLEFAGKDGNTLVIITGDHETGGLTLTGGDLSTGRVEGKFTTKGHTAVMVPVFAFGPGADAFTGIYHNNEIFQKMLDAFGIKNTLKKEN